MINMVYPVLPMLVLVGLLGKTAADTVVGTHEVLETTMATASSKATTITTALYTCHWTVDMLWGRVMTGVEWVGLPMKKSRWLLALVVPLFLLVSMPLLLTRAQGQGNDIWRLTMVVKDVPSNIPSMVLEIYKGRGFPAQSLSSPVVDVEDGTATGTVDVYAYCSDAKIHHGENGHIRLSASYGETM
jgi:hypothetical protein